MSYFIQYLFDLEALQFLGLLGFNTCFGIFGSMQFGVLDGNSTLYSLGNVLAAALVAISLTVEFNLASALAQGSWIAIGLAGLALRAWKTWPNPCLVLNPMLDTETH